LEELFCLLFQFQGLFGIHERAPALAREYRPDAI
jgi:hypothetical protein